eukprot:3024662-Rhodomonas_salina.1
MDRLRPRLRQPAVDVLEHHRSISEERGGSSGDGRQDCDAITMCRNDHINIIQSPSNDGYRHDDEDHHHDVHHFCSEHEAGQRTSMEICSVFCARKDCTHLTSSTASNAISSCRFCSASAVFLACSCASAAATCAMRTDCKSASVQGMWNQGSGIR